MKTITRAGLIVAIFLVGCATGGAASQFVVPPAGAQDVQRWDYLCVKPAGAGYYWETQKQAKKIGAEGWEMALRVNDAICFKRPL